MKYEATEVENLKRHPVSKVYYYVRGRTEMSLKTRDLEKAKLLKEIRENEREALGLSAFRFTVAELYPHYLAYRLAQLEERSPDGHVIRAGTYYEIEWAFKNHLLKYFGKMKLAKVTPREWSKYCERAKVSDLKNHRKVLNGFFAWCEIKGHVKLAPVFKYLPRHDRRTRRIISEGELKAIFQHATGSLRLFLTLALYNGLRRKEIMTLSWEGIDLKERYLTIYSEHNKLRRGRQLPINPTVAALLKERQDEQRSARVRTPWVFAQAKKPSKHGAMSGLKTAWHVCLRKAGLEGITWHDFRATYEKWAHKSLDHTDTQREKFADASIDVQKKIYVSMDHKDLKGLESVVKIDGLDRLIRSRATEKTAGTND